MQVETVAVVQVNGAVYLHVNRDVATHVSAAQRYSQEPWISATPEEPDSFSILTTLLWRGSLASLTTIAKVIREAGLPRLPRRSDTAPLEDHRAFQLEGAPSAPASSASSCSPRTPSNRRNSTCPRSGPPSPASAARPEVRQDDEHLAPGGVDPCPVPRHLAVPESSGCAFVGQAVNGPLHGAHARQSLTCRRTWAKRFWTRFVPSPRRPGGLPKLRKTDEFSIRQLVFKSLPNGVIPVSLPSVG